jgi:hypothetical protein
MKSWLCCIGWIAVAVCASAACGDSDTTGAGGAGGTGGSGGSGGSDGGDICADPDAGTLRTVVCTTVNSCDKETYTGTVAPTYTCTAAKSTKYPDGPNSCRNQSDCDIINTGLVRNIVREVGLSCRSFEPMPGASDAERVAACAAMAMCNTTNVKMATAMKIMPPGISDACGACYTNIALCSLSFCLGECAADADAIGCVKCQFDNGCRGPFEKCSGVDRAPQ